MTVTTTNYDAIRASVDAKGSTESRVEVNQRALIDKILARYASANAVYRELIQNSNDAEATKAEIYFTTDAQTSEVKQVVYRNNGMPFRPQDWSRLKKIAEGNPDVSKVGAFGVGAYTMFSICEEPLVVSGKEALAFVWKGDALWTKVAPNNQQAQSSEWTSFILPSREPYSMPDLVEFGKFLCSSLTFTQCLRSISVFVDNKQRLVLCKREIKEPRAVKPPKASSFWKNDGAITSSSQGIFTLGRTDGSILESIEELTVTLDGKLSTTQARYVSGIANTRIPPAMVRKMERVTKKKPPPKVNIQIFINASTNSDNISSNGASKITSSFSPKLGAGRVFIGFRTSQTTGLAAHLAAPLLPTVEREAIDFQEPTLRHYNMELLEIAGIVMRLALEHSMSLVGAEWEANATERDILDKKYLEEAKQKRKNIQGAVTTQSAENKKEKTEKDESDTSGSGSSLMSFARYMAKGVTKKIVNVINTVDSMVDDGSHELLNPLDPRPLSVEEQHAILLERAFCPQQSTPDHLVGTTLAQGFSRCMPNVAPPVLTRSGIVRGSDARLPYLGIEAFVKKDVVRKVIFENAKEYHEVIARCQTLSINDLATTLPGCVLEEHEVIRILKWWTKFSRYEPKVVMSHSRTIKESIRYFPKKSTVATSGGTKDDETTVIKNLGDLLFYVDTKVLAEGLPMPDTVIPQSLEEEITQRTLSDASLQSWFSVLSIDIWSEFISHHVCMINGQPEDEKLRILVLATLSKEYSRRSMTDRVLFGSFLQSILSNKRCIPFDSCEPQQFAAECPSDLYLNSAELKAFDGIGSFNKVSLSLKDAGVSDEFLLSLGVRKSVSIDFLFTNLDTLRWSDDPKPLVEYLRSASLTNQDIQKLRTTQYLPAENDTSRTFAPSELYLPDPDFRLFPFLRLLQWPSEEDISDKSANGKFLIKLGAKTVPPLHSVLKYITNKVKDDEMRIKCLDYVCQNLGTNSVYEREYKTSSLRSLAFLPCHRIDPLIPDCGKITELRSPNSCYSEPSCIMMGFPVLDPDANKKSGKLYSSRFQLSDQPTPDILISHLLQLVSHSKAKLRDSSGEEHTLLCNHISATFDGIFKYLSSRSTEFGNRRMSALKNESFIPCKSKKSIDWYKPESVYFKANSNEEGSLTELLFHVIDFSPFLAAAGVKSEATTLDLFRLLITSPDAVLKLLGSEAKYRSLLRRIAADPPFRSVSTAIRNSPFLLAYKVEEGDPEASVDDVEKSTEKANYMLAKAEDIFIIDNSFFGRMFPVLQAPHESDLEDFYARIGSSYISKGVMKDYEVIGGQSGGSTATCKKLADRIQERRPLLVSPSVTSRPLKRNASSQIDSKKLHILQAKNLKAVYKLGEKVRNQRITCCAKTMGGGNVLYITEDFDWFDVGYAIGGLILQRCQLEDAWFLGSILEAKLDQLRARGFPVDRILRAVEPVKKEEPKPTVAMVPPPATASPEPQGGRAVNTTNKPDQGDLAETDPKDGFVTIIKQMFPECEDEYIRQKLGPNPTLENVRMLAEEMAVGDYPKKPANEDNVKKNDDADDHSEAPTEQSDGSFCPNIPAAAAANIANSLSPAAAASLAKSLNEKQKRKIGQRLSRAFGGKKDEKPKQRVPKAVQASGPTSTHQHVNDMPTTPGADAMSNAMMEEMLKQTVSASNKVNARGVNSPETVLTSLPDDVARLDQGCEVIPSQQLKVFKGPYTNGKTYNGIRVFASKRHSASEDFLREHFHAVDSFADVLTTLCAVYNLDQKSICIFHEPSGSTIAFNSNRSLHFNVRFFFALHYSQDKQDSYDCFAYWFTTMAHELAHHLATGHNKEHGYYTESYITMFLPKLVSLLESEKSSS